MKVSKWQGQHHHHHAAERIEHLAPELDFVTLRGLAVGVQMLDVLEQVDGAHPVGLEQRHRHHLRTDLGRPAQGRHLDPLDFGQVALGGEFASLGVQQRPGTVPREPPARRLRHRHQKAARVGLEDPDSAHVALGRQRVDVHVEGVECLLFLEPGTGLAEADPPFVAGLEQLRRAVGHRRQVVAGGKGEQREDQAEPEQGPQRPPGAKPAGAQDRVFGTVGQPRHDEDRADQDRDRQQFVQVVGHHQHHMSERLAHGVGRTGWAFADVGQLVDEIEEKEQRQEAGGDERHRCHDLAVDQAPDRPHAVGSCRVAFLRRSRGTDQLLCCLASHSTPARKAPPCNAVMKPMKLVRPPLIQFWPRFSRL